MVSQYLKQWENATFCSEFEKKLGLCTNKQVKVVVKVGWDNPISEEVGIGCEEVSQNCVDEERSNDL